MAGSHKGILISSIGLSRGVGYAQNIKRKGSTNGLAFINRDPAKRFTIINQNTKRRICQTHY